MTLEQVNQVTPATPVAPTPETSKKRVVKRKESVTANVEQPVVDGTEEKDCVSVIPSSRIKNYISKEKLNKELDTLISSVKKSVDPTDLSTLLSESFQQKVGATLKEREEKKKEGEVINIKDVAVEVLSKHRFKFSNSSFKVLSVFLDMMVEEVTHHAMTELVKNKKSIINTKYVLLNENTCGRMYSVYSKLRTYKTSLHDVNTPEEQVVEETTDVTTEQPTEPVVEEAETAESSDNKCINFEFYIRKICNKLKDENEEFSKIKVSEKYQKFCSNLVLDFLDKVVPLTQIVLDIMTTKTITDAVFETVIKCVIFENQCMNDIVSEVHQRLQH
jgi:hypothetical protein